MGELRLVMWMHIAVAALCVLQASRVRVSAVRGDVRPARSMTLQGRQATNKGISCGQHHCICLNSEANCSRVPGGLQHIPPLPANVRYLYFSYNQLLAIPDDFFVKNPKLIKVDISHNNVSFIGPKAFRPLQNLKYLYLSGNPQLTYSSLTPVLNVSSLLELDIMSCGLGPLPADLFHGTALHRLRSMRLHDNGLGDVRLSVFQPLLALSELGLASNDIVHLHVDCTMKSLTKVNLDSNSLYQFPVACAHNGSYLPHLRLLLLQGNYLSNIPERVCLPGVQVLALGENHFSKIEANSFHKERFPSLVQMSMFHMNTGVFEIGKNAFSNPTLQRIDLAFCDINFGSHSVHEDSFADCPSLTNLELSHTKMEVSEDRFVALFGHLKSVNLVDMLKSQLRLLTPRMLSGFRNLTRLHLSQNLIPALAGGLFDRFIHLQDVDLAQNQIRVIPPAAFPLVVRRRLRTVDLSGNPFSCDCDLRWFHAWLTSNRSLFAHSWKNYTCQDMTGLSVQKFSLPQQACLLSRTTSEMISLCCSLAIVTLTVLLLYVRYRWHLRSLCYNAFQSRSEWRRRLLEEGQFQYDVYVCYDVFDEPWVRQHLVTGLEERLGLRLCLQERDMDPSRSELHNVSEAVERSKKVLVLFSTNFTQSPLCQFQLSMCLTHVLSTDDALVIACLDDLPLRAMTSPMMAVLKTTSYIQWADERDAMVAFWARLDMALQEVIQR